MWRLGSFSSAQTFFLSVLLDCEELLTIHNYIILLPEMATNYELKKTLFLLKYLITSWQKKKRERAGKNIK